MSCAKLTSASLRRGVAVPGVPVAELVRESGGEMMRRPNLSNVAGDEVCEAR